MQTKRVITGDEENEANGGYHYDEPPTRVQIFDHRTDNLQNVHR